MAASAAARMSGIDVSHFQKQIDWEQVQRGGIAFAFIKATEGSTLADFLFARNWSEAKVAGVLRGAYHFFRPQVNPLAQAQFFLRRLKSDPGELPPVLDVEVLTGDTTPGMIIQAAHQWMETVEAELGKKPILYTGSAFWRSTLKNSNAFLDHPLWVAHYTLRPNPQVPKPWQQWTFWQFSQQGRMAGIEGNVDLDVFNGTAADLDNFCGIPSPSLNAAAV